jgi:hypothetical protein
MQGRHNSSRYENELLRINILLRCVFFQKVNNTKELSEELVLSESYNIDRGMTVKRNRYTDLL